MAVSDLPGSHGSQLVELVYIGSGSEALVELELVAWELGYQVASHTAEPLTEITEVLRAAELACDEALRRYVPLDEARFCDIFILAWSAGYWSFHRAGARRRRVPTS